MARLISLLGSMQTSDKEEIEVTFPVGYKPDKTAMEGSRTYRKEQLLLRYQFLSYHQLSVNGIVQLVTIVETMLGDIVRAVVARYPKKLGGSERFLFKLFWNQIRLKRFTFELLMHS